MSSSNNNSSGSSSAPWLGLLKWSLQYTDGTRPSNDESSPSPMSEEDRQFLENVMKDGIVNEGQRMQVILGELSVYLTRVVAEEEEDTTSTTTIMPLLEELSDICEQIDFARALMNLGGIPFLLGCASHSRVPVELRQQCLAVLATMAQNNPPVQDALLRDERVLVVANDSGGSGSGGSTSNGLSALALLYFTITQHDHNSDPSGSFRSRVVQALSCAVRGHAVGEETMSRNEHLRSILELGLGAKRLAVAAQEAVPHKLRLRCLFFLRALVTSDTSSRRRVRDFAPCLQKVTEQLLLVNDVDDDDYNDNNDWRELSLGLLVQLLLQKRSVDVILDLKNELVARGVSRVTVLRARQANDENATTELQLWENLIVQLARAERDAPLEEPQPLALLPPSSSTSTDARCDLAQ